MVPMIYTTLVPGLGASVMAVSPVMLLVGLAIVVGVAWAVRGTTEELRRQAVRDFQARAIRLAPKPSAPIAA